MTFGSAYYDAGGSARALDTDNDDQPGGNNEQMVTSFPVAPLVVEEQGTAVATNAGVVGATATFDEVTTASFGSTSSGSFGFTGATSATVDDGLGEAYANESGGFAAYYFNVSAPSTFSLKYDTMDSETEFSNYGPYYSLGGPSGLIGGGFSQSLRNATGSAMYQLTPGAYDFVVQDEYYNDFVAQYGIESQVGSHDDQFSFSISGAPEPSTWALTIVGMSLTGGALRYGRRRPAFATA